MNFALIAPLLLTVVGVGVGALMPRVMSPAAAARTMTAIVIAAGGALVSATVLIALAGLSQFHDAAAGIGWCPALHPDDHGVLVEVAAIATALLGVSSFRGRRYLRAMRQHHATFAGVEGVMILNTDEAVAVAVPGRPGGVVIGAKLMEALDADERSALLAHEQAHLDLHHHRYVHTTGFIAAMIPPLAPLARQVRFATERWADETAAEHIGSRTIVARAIARVALMSPSASTPALAFVGTGTSTRVAALVEPRLKNRLTAVVAIASAVSAVTLAGTSIEFHHLAAFIAAACHP